MNISSINNAADAQRLFASAQSEAAAKDPALAVDERKKQASVAAKQFEAIMLRQLLSPAIEPLMSSGIEGGKSGSSGGGVYGYMLTDVMANSLSQGGGLGLSKILEKQLSPKGGATAATAASTYKIGKMNNNE